MDRDREEFRDQLGRRISTYRSMRDGLRARRAEIDEELAGLDRRLASAESLYEAEFGDDEPMTLVRAIAEAPPRADESGPLTGRSWGDALVDVLQSAAGPLHVKELWRLLQEGGFQTESRDPIRSLVSIMVRDGRFTKAGPNIYGLDPNTMGFIESFERASGGRR